MENKNLGSTDFASEHTDKYSKKRKSQIKLNKEKKNILKELLACLILLLIQEI